MAYEHHIKRDTPITLEEWLEVARADPSLELVEVMSTTNPKTGEVIRIGAPGKALCREIGGTFYSTRRRAATTARAIEDPKLTAES